MEKLITISNDRLCLTITNYGGRVMKWLVDGVDIVLGFDTIDQYKSASEPYHGAIIGRYANRIANSKYSYDGQSFSLDKNHGDHILHGGTKAFHNAIWTVLSSSKTHIEFQNISHDGDQGFPGELTTIARYELNNDTLSLNVTATTTKATPVSITHHPYFNLGGSEGDSLADHEFKIYANEVLEVNQEGIPSGEKIGVSNNGFDFTKWKSLVDALTESHPQMKLLQGIDHTYITNTLNKQLRLQAEARAKNSKVHMQVFSNQPGLQFYTANHFNGSEIGKNDRIHRCRGAFCLEPQMWPNSPNCNKFPPTVLFPNEKYVFSTKYKFASV